MSRGTKRGRQGNGYTWWSLPPDLWGLGAVYAAVFGGQNIAFMPSRAARGRQTVDLKQDPKGVRTSDFIELLKLIVAAQQ